MRCFPFLATKTMTCCLFFCGQAYCTSNIRPPNMFCPLPFFTSMGERRRYVSALPPFLLPAQYSRRRTLGCPSLHVTLSPDLLLIFCCFPFLWTPGDLLHPSFFFSDSRADGVWACFFSGIFLDGLLVRPFFLFLVPRDTRQASARSWLSVFPRLYDFCFERRCKLPLYSRKPSEDSFFLLFLSDLSRSFTSFSLPLRAFWSLIEEHLYVQ